MSCSIYCRIDNDEKVVPDERWYNDQNLLYRGKAMHAILLFIYIYIKETFELEIIFIFVYL